MIGMSAATAAAAASLLLTTMIWSSSSSSSSSRSPHRRSASSASHVDTAEISTQHPLSTHRRLRSRTALHPPGAHDLPQCPPPTLAERHRRPRRLRFVLPLQRMRPLPPRAVLRDIGDRVILRHSERERAVLRPRRRDGGYVVAGGETAPSSSSAADADVDALRRQVSPPPVPPLSLPPPPQQ